MIASNILFSQMKIIYPNGGENFYYGDKIKLIWKDNFHFRDEMSKVEFSSDAGRSWTILDTYILYFQYDWKIPKIKSDSCLIRATQISGFNFKPPIVWSKTYGESIKSMNLTKDGGYILAGSKDMKGEIKVDGKQWDNDWYEDGWIVKLDSNGNKEWEHNFGEVGGNAFYSAIQTKDGGYVAVGKFNLVTALPDYNIFWIVKLDSNGNKKWEIGDGVGTNVIANNIIEMNNGDLVISGPFLKRMSSEKPDIQILRLSPDGYSKWNKIYGGSSYDLVSDILETDNNSLIIAGYTFSNNRDISGNKGLFDGLIIKIDSLGNILWSKTYGENGYDRINSISKTKDGGYIASGSSDSRESYNGAKKLFWLLKLDENGNLEWERRFGTREDDVATRAIETKDGNYIVTGWSEGTHYYNGKNYGGRDYWVVKFNKKGFIIWASNYGGSGEDYAFELFETQKGIYTVGGYSNSLNKDKDTVSKNENFWIIKIDENNYTFNSDTSDTYFSIFDSYTDVVEDTYFSFDIQPNIAFKTTNITYMLNKNGKTTLEVFDVSGRKIATIFSKNQTIGRYNIPIDITKYQSGNYYLRLTTPINTQTKLLIIKN